MNLIGQSFGRYHILEQLGEGGMATVYKAYDTRLDTNVAVKVIRRSAFAPDQLDQMLKRFEREAKSLAKLSHANIVGIIDYGEHEGIPYLVMEYLPGGTLKDKLGRPMPLREAARILIPVARALDFAHRKGMAHRDVKPSNILITDDGDPMLTDFGIAKMLEGQEGLTLTGTGVGIGTPEYMAPEQWTGQAGPSSDIYSLGVVFFEMLTGRKPYVADTPAAVLLKQASDPLPSPRDFVADLPYQAENILFRALAKKPEDRYANMGEFAAALESFQAEPTVIPSQPATATVAVVASQIPPQSEQAKAGLQTMAAIEPEKSAPETVIAVEAPSGGDRGVIKDPPEGGKTKGKGSRWWLWAVAGIVLVGLIAVGVFALMSPKTSIPQNATISSELIAAPTKIPTKAPPPEPTPIPPSECIKPEVYCVALVTDGGKIDDKSFNQSAWDGLVLAKEKGLIQLAHFTETKNPNDFERNIRGYTDGGFDAIVTVGFFMGEATQKAALDYPHVLFIGVDQSWGPDQPWPANLAGVSYPEDEAGFLVGALAARMSQSGLIAAICGTDAVPAVLRFGEGFRAGAAFADQETGRNTIAEVLYHPNEGNPFNDPEWGAEMAKAYVGKSADVIFGCGGETGNGAILSAAQAGSYVIGVDNDQYFRLPEAAPRMLTSAMKHITPSVFEMIESAVNGTFTGGPIHGSASYAPFHDLEKEVPNDVKQWLEEIRIGLKTGELSTGLVPPQSCENDPLGCITIKPGEPIHIAYAMVIEGPDANLGLDTYNGVELALDAIQWRILGHDIFFDGVNSGCNSETGKAAAAELAKDTSIVGVIGPSCSSEVRAGMPVLSKAGFTVISPSSTAPDLTIPGNKNNFPGYLRTSHNDIVQGAAAAEYAYNILGVRTAATIQDGSIYSDRLQQLFADNFIKLGGTITAQVVISPDQANMRPVLTEITKGAPALIYFPIFQPAGTNIITQARATPGLEGIRLMSADSLFSADVVTIAGETVEGLLISSPLVTGPKYDKFIRRYEDKFGTPPISVYHAHAYDALMMLKAAIEKAALVDPDGTLHIGRQALRDALYSTLNYNGITGILSCSSTGDCGNPVIGIYEYTTGEFPPVLIYPK